MLLKFSKILYVNENLYLQDQYYTHRLYYASLFKNFKLQIKNSNGHLNDRIEVIQVSFSHLYNGYAVIILL